MRDTVYFTLPKDEVGAFLFEEYNLITKALSEQTSFEEGF